MKIKACTGGGESEDSCDRGLSPEGAVAEGESPYGLSWRGKSLIKKKRNWFKKSSRSHSASIANAGCLSG